MELIVLGSVVLLIVLFFAAWTVTRNRAIAGESPENQLLMAEYSEVKSRYYDFTLSHISFEGAPSAMFDPIVSKRALELYGPKMEVKARCLEAGIPEWKLKLL